MTLYEFLKSIALIIVFANVTPFLIKNIKSQYNYFLEPCTYIGVLHIKGYISDSSPYTKDLHIFFKDPSIKGIILKIDCFECIAGTSQAICNDIQQLKKEYPKPIVTFVENVCVAGAYLIASSSDYIIAPEHAIIGGIGSYTCPMQLKPMLQLCGIKQAIQVHEKENNQMQNTFAQEIYQQFTKYVATSRKLSLATVSNWAHEKLFTGKQACSIGLINAIGSMHTIIALLKQKALIDGEIELIEKEHTHYRNLLYHLVKLGCNNAVNENLKVA